MSDYVSSSTLKRLFYNKMNERTYPNAPTTRFDWWALAQTLLTGVPATGGIYLGAVWLRKKLRARRARTLATGKMFHVSKDDQEPSQYKVRLVITFANDILIRMISHKPLEGVCQDSWNKPVGCLQSVRTVMPGRVLTSADEERGQNDPNGETEPGGPNKEMNQNDPNGELDQGDPREERGPNRPNEETDSDEPLKAVDYAPVDGAVDPVERREANGEHGAVMLPPVAGANADNDTDDNRNQNWLSLDPDLDNLGVHEVENPELNPQDISLQDAPSAPDGAIARNDAMAGLDPPDISPENSTLLSDGMITATDGVKRSNAPNTTLEITPSVSRGMMALGGTMKELDTPDILIEDFPSVPDGILATIYVPEELKSLDEPGVSSSSTHEHQLEAA